MALLFLHAGHHLDAGTVFSWWTWDPFVILLLAVSGALYAVGLSRLWRRAGVGQGIRRWQAACFAGGFFGYLAAQKELTPGAFRRAMFYGSVMGSFAVERFGTERLQQLSREAIDERFAMFRELTHLD